MKKQYVVTEISAAPDGGPYVLVALTDPRDLKDAPQQRFAPQAMGFSSMEDLMKNLQKAFSGMSKQIMNGMTTVVKLDMREYEDSGLKVGDKVYLEIIKADKEGI